MERDLLAVVPARGGSAGLPGKNIRPFLGIPLIAHTLLMARMSPAISRCVVSTDAPEIAAAAREFGGDVPFLRPPELARSESSIWPVLQHALDWVEREDRAPYRHLALIDPTAPLRLPEWIGEALARLKSRPEADGIIAVSKPDLNPIWVSVVERDGWMTDAFEGASRIDRRQDLPPVFRINGQFYIWRTGFVRSRPSWREGAKLLMFETPEHRAFAIDTLEQFERAEHLVRTGYVQLPWLGPGLQPRPLAH